MKQFRIDRVLPSTESTPRGMQSVVAIATSEKWAVRQFNSEPLGIDTEGKSDPAYGVMLSEFDGQKFVVKGRRFM
jgi:hypothetical protein